VKKARGRRISVGHLAITCSLEVCDAPTPLIWLRLLCSSDTLGKETGLEREIIWGGIEHVVQMFPSGRGLMWRGRARLEAKLGRRGRSDGRVRDIWHAHCQPTTAPITIRR